MAVHGVRKAAAVFGGAGGPPRGDTETKLCWLQNKTEKASELVGG